MEVTNQGPPPFDIYGDDMASKSGSYVHCHELASNESITTLGSAEYRAHEQGGAWPSPVPQHWPKSGSDRSQKHVRSSKHDSKDRPWRETMIRAAPLSGIAAIFLAIGSIIAALGFLVGSAGQATTHWTTPPSTYLAICTAIANLAIRYACLQGVVITWWYKALQGSTVKRLHYDWLAGTTLRGALISGRHMGFLGIACIASTFILADGPLLQHASLVRMVPSTQSAQLNVLMAQQLPTDWSGFWTYSRNIGAGSLPWSSGFNSTVPMADGTSVSNHIQALPAFSNSTSQIERLYIADAPLSDVAQGCDGECAFTLRAPALAVNSCTTETIHADYWHGLSSGYKENQAALPLSQLTFSTTLGLVVDGEIEHLYAVSAYADSDNCTGTISYTTCTLRSATGDYEAILKDGKVTLDTAIPEIVAVASNTPVNQHYNHGFEGYPSTLALVAYVGTYKWDDVRWYFEINNSTFSMMELGNGIGMVYQASMEKDVLCTSYHDPHADLLASLNKAMVYSGMVAAQLDPGYLEANTDEGFGNANQTTTGQVVGMHSVYATDFRWFVAAAAVELLCILLVAPTYWGFWRIGRSVSFSPVEIAMAFASPILADVKSSNASGREIAKEHGDVQIRYGVASSPITHDSKAKLVFADPSLVDSPRSGKSL